MEKLFLPYELALEIKTLGFDEPCLFDYNRWNTERLNDSYFNFVNYNAGETMVSAPLFQQVFKWFREKYELSCSIELTDNSRDYYYDFTISDSKNRDWNDIDCFDSCKRIYDKEKHRNYEEAELECLKKLIEIVKKQKEYESNIIV